ncbi:MAG: hybrid sensor histidine kinase/response regulator [Candidatus Riflebacteria bacterium]|nr:hybrid sensor histidine kinase/response regulator [Candidatus Riflebacteria bacterium]
MEQNSPKMIVLIVDDVLENIEILGRALSSEYKIKVAKNGIEALKVAESADHPDLILLDIMMPGIDGYEVCRRLKANQATRDIPVIFLSALSEDSDKTMGLELGAMDFITKPFNSDLVKLRVRNHLALCSAKLELQKHNEHLEDLIRERSRELATAHERLKVLDDAKGDFLRAISHELRTPISGILGIGKLALNSIQNNKEREELTECFESSSKRLMSTVNNALRLAQLQAGDASLKVDAIKLKTLIVAAIDNIGPIAAKAGITLSLPDFNDASIIGDETLLKQAMETMIHTMVKMSASGNEVRITFLACNAHLELAISSNGRTLPEASLSSFFATFSTARTSSFAEELGLAIPVAAKIIMAMGGEVRIQNLEPSGLRMICVFPKVGNNETKSDNM